MKTDTYTKIVLTVIAIALSVIAFQNVNFVTIAKADTTASAPAPLPAATQNAPVDVNITHIDGEKINISRNYNSYNGLPVQIYHNYDK
ncbi:hypothetical protein [Dysgonomonas macrotermitis]|uniref:Uncharacterized protein n=1 Tax=Dysgonomonas macrotermitis TaxID=1346286 RepID=A0A1M5HCC3_9BACT|nr:hypothetical protein [Dysgonomonas macrotermitis]SHG13593.1 hypothetical protein SAMN05444362_11621 [Dysgonomonas macrotermitis]